MSFNDPNFWAAMLGGGVIGAIISALATVFFGARWVERSRLKREHSTKLIAGAVDESLAKILRVWSSLFYEGR